MQVHNAMSLHVKGSVRKRHITYIGKEVFAIANKAAFCYCHRIRVCTYSVCWSYMQNQLLFCYYATAIMYVFSYHGLCENSLLL